MEITEVRVKLVNVKNDKLRAFCSITVDNDFVIRDLKVIEGAKGAFVAMPSRKLTERCSRCSGKNHYRARYCNDCGARLGGDRGGRSESSTQKMHTDIAHPINSRCREVIQKRVLEVYNQEVQKSTEPDYQPMEFEVFDEESLAEDVVDVGGRGAEAALESHAGGDLAPSGNGGTEGNGHHSEEAGELSSGSPPGVPAGTAERGPAQSGRPREGRRYDSPSRDGGEDRGRRHRRGGHRGNRGDRVGADRGGGDRGDGARLEGNRGEGNRGESRRGGGGWGGRGRGGDAHRDAGRHRPEGDRSAGERGHPSESGMPRREEEVVEAMTDRDLSSRAAPPRPPVPAEPDPEPEDNFGAGLFN